MIRSLTRVVVLIAAFGIGGNVARAEAPATSPSAAEKSTDGKYYLIWRVTAPKVEVGAEVEVEPAFFTNGEKIVFAWDYCRAHFPKQNYPVGDPEERKRTLDPKLADSTDRRDLEPYCRLENTVLDVTSFLILDNTGARLTLSKAIYTPPDFRTPKSEEFRATITGIDGKVPPKLAPAIEAKQPYVFLMARNHTVLRRLVPVTTNVDPAQAQALLNRHEQYLAKRQEIGAEAVAKEECGSVWPAMYKGWENWRVRGNKQASVAEGFYVDVDADGNLDLVSRFIEEPLRTSMTRLFLGNGSEECILRDRTVSVRNVPAAQPISVVTTKECVYVFTVLGDAKYNPVQVLFPQRDRGGICPALESYRRSGLHG